MSETQVKQTRRERSTFGEVARNPHPKRASTVKTSNTPVTQCFQKPMPCEMEDEKWNSSWPFVGLCCGTRAGGWKRVINRPHPINSKSCNAFLVRSVSIGRFWSTPEIWHDIQRLSVHHVHPPATQTLQDTMVATELFNGWSPKSFGLIMT